MHSGAIYCPFKQSIPWQVFSFYAAVFFHFFLYAFHSFFLSYFLPFWSFVNLKKSNFNFYWLPSAAFGLLVLAHFMPHFNLFVQILQFRLILKKKIISQLTAYFFA